MDQLEKLFSDLRAETLPQVRPPGAGAARRTVRRRRGVTSAAAALAVVVVVAGLAAGLRGGREETPPATPPVSGDTWLAWAGEAARAVDIDLDTPVMGGALKEGFTGINAAVGGLYQAKVACVGDGSVTVTFVAAAGGYPSETSRLVVACGRTAKTAATWFSVPGQEGKVLASYVADTKASGLGAAVAFHLNLAQVDRYRLRDLANAAFKDPTPRNLVLGWGSFLDDEASAGHDVVRPGRYRVSAACGGTGIGKVLLTVSAVPDRGRATPVARTTLACGMTPQVTSVIFMIPKTPALALDTALDPSQPARGQIATSVRIERI